jgi:hypothetical protein
MRFKEYYHNNKKDTILFERIFEKFYKKGYFGDIDKENIRIVQYEWYKTMKKVIREKDAFILFQSLTNKENHISREYFSKLTGIDVRHKTKEVVVDVIKEFLKVEIGGK